MSLSKSLLFLGGLASIGATGVVANADSLSYDVQSGDTLSEIAESNNLTVDKIVSDNNIADPNMIYVGQQLVLNTDDASGQEQVDEMNYVAPVQYDQNLNTQDNVDYVDSNYSEPQYETYENTYDQVNESQEPVSCSQPDVSVDNGSDGEASAKEWIAQRESGGSYSATNGQYIGRYQLSSAYLNGDYSAENQERVAQQYVEGRYGSWQNAQSFWMQHGWY